MSSLLSLISAALSSFCAGIAWLLHLLPIPWIAAARWFDRQAVALRNRDREDL